MLASFLYAGLQLETVVYRFSRDELIALLLVPRVETRPAPSLYMSIVNSSFTAPTSTLLAYDPAHLPASVVRLPETCSKKLMISKCLFHTSPVISLPFECSLNPLPTLAITPNLPSRSECTRQQACFASEEQASKAQKCVCSNITQCAWFHYSSEVRQLLLSAAGEPYSSWLFFGFESVEEGCSVRSESVGEKDS